MTEITRWGLVTARFGAGMAVLIVMGGCNPGEPAAVPGTGAPSSSVPSMVAPSPTVAPTSRTPGPGRSAVGTEITTGSSEFGPMLFDGAGRAIYIWEVETSSEPRCYGDCADAWPPVLSAGPPSVAGDVDASKVATVQRRDGGQQVTYNGHPLYYYAHELPGEVKCHNIRTHGGLWWVVTPAGDRAR